MAGRIKSYTIDPVGRVITYWVGLFVPSGHQHLGEAESGNMSMNAKYFLIIALAAICGPCDRALAQDRNSVVLEYTRPVRKEIRNETVLVKLQVIDYPPGKKLPVLEDREFDYSGTAEKALASFLSARSPKAIRRDPGAALEALHAMDPEREGALPEAEKTERVKEMREFLRNLPPPPDVVHTMLQKAWADDYVIFLTRAAIFRRNGDVAQSKEVFFMIRKHGAWRFAADTKRIAFLRTMLLGGPIREKTITRVSESVLRTRDPGITYRDEKATRVPAVKGVSMERKQAGEL